MSDDRQYRLIRIAQYIVEILVSIFIILPIIKRYIEYKKRQDIKEKGRDIVVMQQEISPLLRKSGLGRLNSTTSKNEIPRSSDSLKEA